MLLRYNLRVSTAVFRYCVYGIGIASDSPLAMPRYAHDALGTMECRRADASLFLKATQNAAFDSVSGSWYHHAILRDGSTYVRWDTVGEFLVAADGRRITCRRLDRSSAESFQVYMLGQALSFALVKQRFEPLHATVVVVRDRAVAFLGGNAFGKSTLAASFLQAGDRLLTDDLLIVHESSTGLLAYPGPPRIKLFPRIAHRVLGGAADGVAMNPDTDKLILRLDDRRTCSHPVPLAAIYSLSAPRDTGRRQDVAIETAPPREAFVDLVKNAFNRRLAGRTRLERQFGFMTRLTDLVPIRKLVYPRALDRLADVRAAVLADIR